MSKLLRCIGNMDDMLRLTVGKVYETQNHSMVNATVVVNDRGEIQAYPKHLFASVDAVIGGVGSPTKQHPAPMFCIGDCIDLRYITNDSLPNRIQITTIFMNRRSKEWEYGVEIESIQESSTMGEQFIKDRMRNRGDAPVYNLSVIQRRYAAGFRWVGNYTEETAYNKMKQLRQSGRFSKVEVREAYDREGNFVTGKLAVWVRYPKPLGLDPKMAREKGSIRVTMAQLLGNNCSICDGCGSCQ